MENAKNSAKKRLNIKKMLTSIIFVLVYSFINTIVPFKPLIIFSAIATPLLMALTVYIFVPKRKKSDRYNRGDESSFFDKHPAIRSIIILSALMLPFWSSIKGINSYTYNTSFFPFWVIPAILGIVAGVLMFIYSVKGSKLFLRTFVSFIIGVLAAFICCGYIMNLNYAFDASEPEVCMAVIEDKNRRSGTKSPTVYEFDITIDGEKCNLYVTSGEYNYYDVGDTVIFYKYKGAFRKPFYISESKR